MTEKIEITLAELGERIDILLRISTQVIASRKIATSEDRENVEIRLDATDDFYNHIEIIPSDWINIGNTQIPLGGYLYIKNLIITDIKSLERLGIMDPQQVVDKIIFEDIEFSYSTVADKSKGPILLTIILAKYHVVKFLKCTTKNDGALIIHYHIPDKDITENKITVKECKFKDFSITASSDKNPETSENKTLISPEKVSINDVSMVIDKNFFEQFSLTLYKSKNIEYDYRYKAKIIKGNDIGEIIIRDEYPDVIAWGTRENIGERISKEYKTKTESDKLKKHEEGTTPLERTWDKIENNKAVLMKFKQLAADKEDIFQESTINYHIAKCNEQLIYLENWKGFVQDKAVMFLGKTLSNHGTSWSWPLTWIISINFIASIIIFHILNDSVCQYVIKECNFWYIFGEIFNPLSTPTGIAEGIKGDDYKPLKGPYIGVAISVLLSKAFYAMCIYEFVRAARRFTLK